MEECLAEINAFRTLCENDEVLSAKSGCAGSIRSKRRLSSESSHVVDQKKANKHAFIAGEQPCWQGPPASPANPVEDDSKVLHDNCQSDVSLHYSLASDDLLSIDEFEAAALEALGEPQIDSSKAYELLHIATAHARLVSEIQEHFSRVGQASAMNPSLSGYYSALRQVVQPLVSASQALPSASSLQPSMQLTAAPPMQQFHTAHLMDTLYDVHATWRSVPDGKSKPTSQLDALAKTSCHADAAVHGSRTSWLHIISQILGERSLVLGFVGICLALTAMALAPHSLLRDS